MDMFWDVQTYKQRMSLIVVDSPQQLLQELNMDLKAWNQESIWKIVSNKVAITYESKYDLIANQYRAYKI